MSEKLNTIGNIYISPRAIATIAYQSALETYGLVGLAPKNLAANLANVLVKDPTMGVDVEFKGEKVNVDLYIIVEYGTRITTVAASVASSVRYQIENTTGLSVGNVNIHVRGLRISNPD